MEFNEKAFARQKFRSSRGRGRGGRGGAHRAGQYSTGPARQAQRDLDSNAFRYEDDADKEDDGIVPPKSQGADLEALIEDADVQFNQAFYRFRAQLHDITEEVPPLGATRPEQLLAIDLEALAASLSALPLHELLGLEPEYLEGVEVGPQGQGQVLGQQPSGSRPAAPSGPEPGRGPPELATALATGSTPSAGAVQTAPVGATHALSRPGIPVPVPVPVGVAAAASFATAYITPAASTPGPAAVQAPAMAGAAAVSAGGASAAAVVSSAVSRDDVDDELDALLMGRVPQSASQSAQPAAPSGAAPSPLAGMGLARPAAGPVFPPALAAAMAAARPPQPTAMGLPPERTAQAESAPAQGDGPSHPAGVAGPGPGSAAPGYFAAGVQQGAVRLAEAGLPSVYAAPAASLPAMSAGVTSGPAGVVRLTAAGIPAGMPVGRGTGLVAGQPAPAPVPPTAGRGTAAAPVVVGLPSARLVGPPALALAQQSANRASAAAAGGGKPTSSSGPGGSGGAVMDDELRLLLGLPVDGAQKASPASATPQAPAQTKLRLGSGGGGCMGDEVVSKDVVSKSRSGMGLGPNGGAGPLASPSVGMCGAGWGGLASSDCKGPGGPMGLPGGPHNRSLVGLAPPMDGAGGARQARAAAATPQAPSQPRPAVWATPTVTLPPAGGRPGPPPAPQQSPPTAAKSLDDWLSSL